ncbi:poly-gamma-glutamate synthesis protein (capsule biosynthesis protein) [Rhodococcus wratislaviensis]|uniref:Bacterial capsule synthesis protein PGA_cap n=1 Tax=Rhodococcus wratislaviensis TaxID=44752 RepID=A0AB38F5L9_RHOWR|nr:CapA family protein [Rhodococcus wratislaviensis]REE70917.1 poly-gamma-glutamate synthesis protein (capsule biosynthesis protein) [Rhodococcus wratislaviensis]SPZ34594.1 Bacterial capsule synthesis protein PGA_cap [Rhodococcus wratislaviensis]
MSDTITMFLAGDVMTGRGVDQILPFPGDPELRERCVHDAREYVALAEKRNGSIRGPVGFGWPWGEALPVLDTAEPDARVINLETTVTTCARFASKGINYRMHPSNLGVLTAARIDVCVLANNHLLDFGADGLVETLDALARNGVRTVGAGRTVAQAWCPVVVEAGAGRRLLIWAAGMTSSGVSPRGAARRGRPGVAFLSEPTGAEADRVLDRTRLIRRNTDVVVVSLHWGSNWGYDVPDAHVEFAHRLVDGGVDVVFGHSSHHPRPVEIYRGHPILYGCGDLINDYEGIGGHEGYRDDLRLLYLVTLDARTHELCELRMVPMSSRQMRLQRASTRDTEWLRRVLDGISRGFGTRIDAGDDVLVARARHANW